MTAATPDGSADARAVVWLKSAVLSPCGLYRYRLWRRWADRPYLCFVMLNPSTADAEQDDPTIRKCMGFAKRLGCGGIDVVNCYAWRTSEPRLLYNAMRSGLDVVGPDNDRHIGEALDRAGRVVAAWGANKVFSRPHIIDVRARGRGKRLEAIAITGKGAPQHPLMAKYVDDLVPFEVPS